MVSTHRPLLTCLASATFFTFLFKGTGIGLNLLLFEVFVLGALFITRRFPMEGYVLLTVSGTLITAIMVVLYGSTLALIVNLLSVALTIGVLLAPELGALHHAAALAGAHMIAAQRSFLRLLPVPGNNGSGLRITPRGVFSITLVPLILLLFSMLYSASNPYFGELAEGVHSWISHIDASLPVVFLIGLVLSTFLLVITHNERMVQWMKARMDTLLPSDLSEQGDRMHALRNEAAIGILLLGGLNALLLLLNALDIHHVWFNFHFEGQYLKAFVHQGTWLLILSIVLGALIVLYYFRGDLNFYRKNRTIKWLSYLWLTQNLVLVVSVAIRNYWYIHHYALAYKRIGVAFFLLATLVGLLLIMVKVRDQRSHHFLVRWNMVSIYSVALLMTLVDWDVVIARYNMAHRERAFVELDYLATLGDKTLPYMMRSTLELENLDRYNARSLGLPERQYRSLYMPPARFATHIHDRVEHFRNEYPDRSWREWTLADARTYAGLCALKEQ